MNRNLNSNTSWIKPGKELLRKIWAQRKKILYFLLVVLSLVSYFLFRLGKNYFSPPQLVEEKLSEEIYEEDTTENPREELKTVNQEQEQIIHYFRQIVTNIRSENLHGSVIIPGLRSAQQRANNTPYLLCTVANCQWTAARIPCEHNCYFRCLETDCAFANQESYQYQDYCVHHTCQQCQELVIIYTDNYCEKYCGNCLPKTAADYPTPIF